MHLETNIQWARNTKYSLLNIQNLWNRIASRIVNFPVLHTTLIILHQLHNQEQNTINSNLNTNVREWKTWRRTLILALQGATSLQSCMHLILRIAEQNWDDRMTVGVFFLLYTSSLLASHRCGVEASQVLESQSDYKVQYGVKWT